MIAMPSLAWPAAGCTLFFSLFAGLALSNAGLALSTGAARTLPQDGEGTEENLVQRYYTLFSPPGIGCSQKLFRRASKLPRVSQWKFIVQAKKKLYLTFKLTDSVRPVDLQRFYLVDPLENLMMSYSGVVNPSGITQDLKLLLGLVENN